MFNLKKLKFYKNYPTVLLSAAPKEPEFCLLVEEKPDS